MKKLSIFATSLAAIILLTACPNKPNEPQPLTLAEAIGEDYTGTLTVEVERVGVAERDRLSYTATGGIMSWYLEGVDPDLACSMYWEAALPDAPVEIGVVRTFVEGEFREGVIRFPYRTTYAYPLQTRWGKVTLYPNYYGTYLDYWELPIDAAIERDRLTFTWADTVSGFEASDGGTCTLILNSTVLLSR